jgi:hypothetical protein
MTPGSSRTAQLAVLASCLIATGCFAGAVTQRALFCFVLPGLILGACAVEVLQSSFSWRSALSVSIGLCLAWAEVANLATGTSNGPAAKATFAAGALTSAALAASATRMPALFLLPMSGVVVAADLYGAGDEVPLLAVLTGGAAVVALASVESARRRGGRPGSVRESYWSVAALALLIMVAGSAAVLTQVRHDGRHPHTALSAIRNSAVRPFWGDPFPSTATTRAKRHHSPAAPPRIPPTHHSPEHRSGSHAWALIVLALLVALAMSIAIRLLLVRRAWAHALRILRADPPEGMVGAWIWATLRFRAYRMPLPPQLSPDRVARGAPIHEVPPDTAEPLRQLGLLVAPVAFRSPHAVADTEGVDAAWGLAKAACAAAEGSLGGLGRLRVRFVAPGAFVLHLGN